MKPEEALRHIRTLIEGSDYSTDPRAMQTLIDSIRVLVNKATRARVGARPTGTTIEGGAVTCPECRGTGRFGRRDCHECNGTGFRLVIGD
jgi:hypothetical protein